MKKYCFMLLLIPVLGMGQTKTILSSNRLFVKTSKIAEFEKALANHAQKYHTGDVSWRVWSIESGPDYGGYMVTEGPTNWSNLDTRNDISAAHTTDWVTAVAPLTEGRSQGGYFEFKPDLSTVQLTDYADKIIINHLTAKPGKIGHVEELIKKLKKVWEASKESVAVYAVIASGEPGYIAVSRLKDGFKELSADYRKPLPERYNEVHGAGAFDTWLKDYENAVQLRWSEILIYNAGLSSK